MGLNLSRHVKARVPKWNPIKHTVRCHINTEPLAAPESTLRWNLKEQLIEVQNVCVDAGIRLTRICLIFFQVSFSTPISKCLLDMDVNISYKIKKNIV